MLRAPDATPLRRGSSAWLAASGAIALLVLVPLGAVAATALRESAGLWQHLVTYVVPVAARETLILLAGVGALVTVIGAGTAWLVAAHAFPGRRVLEWALLLPLAVPTYIIAYAYLDILHPVGPVQTALRSLLGFDSPRDFRLPDIRSMPGAIVLLGFVLYPYVYLPARAMFVMQSASVLEAARTLGIRRRALFFRVALPLARPAVAVGLTLALLEALNDIGASEFLGVRTMTVSIYTTWATRSDVAGAVQIALAMLAIVLALVLLERRARRQQRYAADAQHPRPLEPTPLGGLAGMGALAVCLAPVAVGFLAPFIYLVDAALDRIRFAGVSEAIVREALNTVTVSLIATALTIAGGVVVAYSARLSRRRLAQSFARAASLGYAVPGTVLALGVLPVATALDAPLDRVASLVVDGSVGLLILGSGAALVYAYVVRFLALAIGGVESGLSRVSASLDDAARTLAAGPGARLWRLHLPLVRPAVAAAAMLVFVDCMKELPATLLLRPLGFETLATHLYGEAVRGTYEDAALAALLIVAVGLLPVILLARLGRVERQRDHVPITGLETL
jgi:iron(III) transport system permease protein